MLSVLAAFFSLRRDGSDAVGANPDEMSAAPPTTRHVLGTPVFATVYAEHFKYVWRTLARLGVRDAELEDAAQEVFVVVHRRLDSYDPQRPIKPWLCGIAHRVATAERRRARHRRERLCEAPAAGAVAQGSPEGQAVLRQRFNRVRLALGALDPNQRVVFVMAEMEEIACPDIADSLGIPVNTVYSRLRRARARFKAELQRLRCERGEA